MTCFPLYKSQAPIKLKKSILFRDTYIFSKPLREKYPLEELCRKFQRESHAVFFKLCMK